MKKINITFLLILMVALVGCIGKEKGKLTRVDVQKMNPYGDIVMITDSKSIELLSMAFEKVKWEPKVKPKIARKPDVKATLFFEIDKNMPERLFEYEIWFKQNIDTVTIISNNQKEGYGELSQDNADMLKRIIVNNTTDWKFRYEYMEKGNVLFRINPDPELAAGKPYGYMFSFLEPFETYKGKELAIFAYHKETGEQVTVLSPIKITEPSSGYSSLNRFTTTFELPLGGIWRIEVVLDEQILGDVVIPVKE